MSDRDLVLSDATALLVGTSRYPGDAPELTIAHLGATLDSLADVLVRVAGMRPERVRVLLDRPLPAMGDALDAAIAEADGPLLFVFVGHGLNVEGELYLAAADTLEDRDAWHRTALSYRDVSRDLRRRARPPVIAILDCCFSREAVLVPHRVDFLLMSAGDAHLAVAVDGRPAFTDELVRLLEHGDPYGPADLTLDAVHTGLRRELREGCPRPEAWGNRDIGGRVLARNRAPWWPYLHDVQRRKIPMATCPYPGLAAFDEDEAPLYHGRNLLIARLLGRIRGRHTDTPGQPLLITGVSGAGKSSLLRAGLLSALRHGALGIEGSGHWPHVPLSPGPTPLRALADAVAAVAAPGTVDAATLADQLRRQPDRLVDELRRVADHAGADRVVLVVDQLEELFALVSDTEARDAFVTALGHAAAGDGRGPPPASVVLSLRVDFLGQCRHPVLLAALADRFEIEPMTRDELIAAITGPATAADLRVEPELLDALLRDLAAGDADQAGASGRFEVGRLPLLAHALRQTWEHWARRGDRGVALTKTDYDLVGGIPGALAATAQQALENLTPRALEDARRLLLRLVKVDPEGADTRRRLGLDELLAPLPDAARARTVLDRLVDARVVTCTQDTVQITHEALLVHLEPLRRWLDEIRRDALLAESLADRARRWDGQGRPADLLARGAELTSALRWADTVTVSDPTVEAFLDAGHNRRRVSRLTAVSAVAIVVALLSGAVAFRLARAVDDEQRAARARRVLDLAATLAPDDPDTALRLTLAAQAIDGDARPELVRALLDSPYAGALARDPGLPPPDGPALAPAAPVTTTTTPDPARPDRLSVVTADPGGKLAIVGDLRNGLSVWQLPTRNSKTDKEEPQPRPTRPAHLSDLGRDSRSATAVAMTAGYQALVGNGAGRVQVWDVRPGVTPGADRETRVGAPVTALAYVAGGPGAVIAAGRGLLRWRTDMPGNPEALGGGDRHRDDITDVAVTVDGRWAVTSSVDGTGRVWDLTDPARPSVPLAAGEVELTSVAVATRTGYGVPGNEADYAVLGGGNGTVSVWALPDDGPPRPLATRRLHDRAVTDVALTPTDGLQLVTAGADRTARVWDLADPADPRPLGVLRGHAGKVSQLALYHPDEATRQAVEGPPVPGVISIGDDGRALLWDLLDRAQVRNAGLVRHETTGWTGHITAVAFDRRDDRGGTLLTANTNRRAFLWGRGQAEPDPLDHAGPVLAAAVNGGGLAVTGSTDRTAKLWKLDAPSESPLTFGHEGPVTAVAFTGDEPDRVVTRADGPAGKTHVVVRDTGGHVVASAELAAAAQPMAAGAGLVVLGDGGDGELRNAADLAVVGRLEGGDTGRVRAVAVSPATTDGRRWAATGGDDGAVALWDVTTPSEPRRWARLDGHTDAVRTIAFAPDGRTMVTGGDDHTAIVWDVTGDRPPQRLAGLRAQDGAVLGAAFGPHGRIVATGSEDFFVRVYDLRAIRAIADDPVAYACATTGGSLDRTAWDRLIGDGAWTDSC